MELTLYRKWLDENSTVGVLDVDGVFQCYTLELPTPLCIPPGRFKVSIDYSPKFQRNMPILLAVPGRTEIRIHWGNDEKDTEGCILVGTSRSLDWIGNSRDAFADLFPKIQQAVSLDDCYITVTLAQ